MAETPTSLIGSTAAEHVRSLLDDAHQGDPPSLGLELEDHLLFCQMDFLCHFDDGEIGWKEASRWLKYEEKVEPGGRWSQPHVTTTSLHALEVMREALTSHPVLLDITPENDSIDAVMAIVADAVTSHLQLSAVNRSEVLRALVSPHAHAHRKGKKRGHTQRFPFSKRFSDTLYEVEEEELSSGSSTPKSKNYGSIADPCEKSSLIHGPDSYFLTYENGVLPSTLSPYEPNRSLMRKIPTGTEAANILVGKLDIVSKPVMVLGRLSNSKHLGDLTEVAVPTRFIFVRLAPADETRIWQHGEIGRAMAALWTDRVFCEVAYRASSKEQLQEGLQEYIEALTTFPPSIWDPLTRLDPPDKKITIEKVRQRLTEARITSCVPEVTKSGSETEMDSSLKPTGRFCGGLIADVKRRYPWWGSDVWDALHIQCIASIVFIFFACITPTVTFGGVIGTVTGNYMGVIESILATTVVGILWHLFAGQPLTIMGTTGPALVFEKLLYSYCVDYRIDYLSFRFWIGMWIMVILLLGAMLDLSAVIRYITRFTEECFALLIALIFIMEAVEDLIRIWNTYPIQINTDSDLGNVTCHCVQSAAVNTETVTSQSGLFSQLSMEELRSRDCLLIDGQVAVNPLCVPVDECEKHEGWRLEGLGCDDRYVTSTVPDVFLLSLMLFCITFVVAFGSRRFRDTNYFPTSLRNGLCDFGVLFAIIISTAIDYFIGIDTPKLSVPSEFKTTKPDRGWLVQPMDVTHWWLILVAIIPGFLACILFFLDQQITGILVNRHEHKLKKGHGYHLDLFVMATSVGFCSLFGLPWFVAATVRSLAHVRSLVMISEVRAPGEKAEFLGIREQRVTGTVVHILIGLSVFAAPYLKVIPMAVLFGVFMYMGICAMSDLQFVDRVFLYFIPKKYHPDYPYLRHVATYRVYLFTFIQVVCMVVMWVSKSIDVIAIGFPITILLIAVVRKSMECCYTETELYWLDDLFPTEKDDAKAPSENEGYEAYKHAHHMTQISGRSHLSLPDKSFIKAEEYLAPVSGRRRLSFDAVGKHEGDDLMETFRSSGHLSPAGVPSCGSPGPAPLRVSPGPAPPSSAPGPAPVSGSLGPVPPSKGHGETKTPPTDS